MCGLPMAAHCAEPGIVFIVHEGTYKEPIRPYKEGAQGLYEALNGPIKHYKALKGFIRPLRA